MGKLREPHWRVLVDFLFQFLRCLRLSLSPETCVLFQRFPPLTSLTLFAVTLLPLVIKLSRARTQPFPVLVYVSIFQ